MTGDPALKGLRVLLTRPPGRARSLHQALAAGGARVSEIPVLEILPLPLDHVGRTLIQKLDEFEIVIFVSRAAAEIGLEQFSGWWPQWPVGLTWVAVGAGSATRLEAAGLEVLRPDAGASENSEGVLALPVLQAAAGARILLCRGEGGRGLIAEGLRERGARVEELVLYRREMPARGAAELGELLAGIGIDVILVYSVDSLRNLVKMAGEREKQLKLTRILVPGARVAAAAREMGFRDVIEVPGTADEAMLAALGAMARDASPPG